MRVGNLTELYATLYRGMCALLDPASPPRSVALYFGRIFTAQIHQKNELPAHEISSPLFVTPPLGRQLGPVEKTNWGVASASEGSLNFPLKWSHDADDFPLNDDSSLLPRHLGEYFESFEDTVTPSLLQVISGLGHGGFGCVVLVVDKTTDHEYAMKTISKQIGVGRTIDKLRIESEADALAMPHSLFLQKCYKEFQSSNNVFFVLEYIEGAPLFNMIISCFVSSPRRA